MNVKSVWRASKLSYFPRSDGCSQSPVDFFTKLSFGRCLLIICSIFSTLLHTNMVIIMDEIMWNCIFSYKVNWGVIRIHAPKSSTYTSFALLSCQPIFRRISPIVVCLTESWLPSTWHTKSAGSLELGDAPSDLLVINNMLYPQISSSRLVVLLVDL